MRLREGAHRRSDSFADDRGSRRRFEQALRGRQPPFETARFGRCHGDSIDVEFFCELTIALSTWRQTGATVMLVPSGARISFRPPRLRIEIGTRPRAEARWHAQSERIFIGGKFQRELLVVASPERCNLCPENFQAGIEVYGGLGTHSDFGLHETSHYVAPVLAWLKSCRARFMAVCPSLLGPGTV